MDAFHLVKGSFLSSVAIRYFLQIGLTHFLKFIPRCPYLDCFLFSMGPFLLPF